MARTKAWETHIRQAAEKLSRACAELAERLSGDEAAAREIKELAAAMKELVNMCTAMQKQPPAKRAEEKQKPAPAYRIAFDPDAEKWKA